MKTICRLFALFFAVGLDLSNAWSEPLALSIAARPAEVFQGAIAELQLSGVELAAVEGRLGNEKVRFFPDDKGDFTALVGIDLEAKPGPTKIHITSTTRAGVNHETQFLLKIKAKTFPQEAFSVAPQFDQLTPEVLERVRREQERLARVLAVSTPVRLWAPPFIKPVAMGVSSPFGYRRVVNGTPRAPHTGVDLRAPLATEVAAANRGRVVLVGDFFFPGKSVVLDHGGGLYTLYFHLSEFKVDEGAEVEKGTVIGLSGMTGRVTGPHLHWSARLNGARVDPFELVEK